MRTLAALMLAALGALPLAASAQDVAELTADTRAKALPVLPKVVGMMQDTVAAEGVENAIPVCKDKAPLLLKQRAEETGWTLRRVSLKVRNPERGTADLWEARHLADFDVRAANGEKPEKLEVGEIVTQPDGKKVFRYLRAVPVGEVCVKCHGDPAQMPAGLKAKLAESYPKDQATGYRQGQIRGALSVLRPL